MANLQSLTVKLPYQDLETQIYVIVKEPFRGQQEPALQDCISCGIKVFWLYVLLITPLHFIIVATICRSLKE